MSRHGGTAAAAAAALVALALGGCSSSSDNDAASAASTTAAPSTTAVPAEPGTVLFSPEGNNLWAYETTPPFRAQKVNTANHSFGDAPSDPEGWDINGQVCAFVNDGKRYIIRLRSGVPFHDGSTMNADDVVTSLQRWGRLSPRGRTPWTFLDSISAKDPGTIEIVLTRPYSPLLNLLAFPNGSPQIMPKRVATAPDPLKDFTGTGPFKLIEYKPDTWVRVGKFAQYVSPPVTGPGPVGVVASGSVT